MQRLGIYGRMSEIKIIPDIIFSADKQTRIDVLCGLLETDGWVEGNNALRFSSASKFLSDGVIAARNMPDFNIVTHFRSYSLNDVWFRHADSWRTCKISITK